MPVERPEPANPPAVDGRAIGMVTAVIVVLCSLVVLVLRPASFADRLVALLFGVGLAALIVLLTRRRAMPVDDPLARRGPGLTAGEVDHPVIPADLVQPGAAPAPPPPTASAAPAQQSSPVPPGPPAGTGQQQPPPQPQPPAQPQQPHAHRRPFTGPERTTRPATHAPRSG